MKKLSNRVGETNVNKYGSLMEVIEYKGSPNVLIKFIKNGNLVNCNWRQFSVGNVKDVYDKSVFGVGYIGEGECKVSINGKLTKQYAAWNGMLSRCYSEVYQNKQPTYKNCIVDVRWHNFQNFAKWFDENYYEIDNQRMHLDKDILLKGNKLYSPETCLFVPQSINSLFTKSNSSRGNLPVGVAWHKTHEKYIAQCSNTIKGCNSKIIHLGYYNTPEEAFQSYKTYKELLIKQTAEEYKDTIPDKLYDAMKLYTVNIDD
jgi:hypothetical protein